MPGLGGHSPAVLAIRAIKITTGFQITIQPLVQAPKNTFRRTLFGRQRHAIIRRQRSSINHIHIRSPVVSRGSRQGRKAQNSLELLVFTKLRHLHLLPAVIEYWAAPFSFGIKNGELTLKTAITTDQLQRKTLCSSGCTELAPRGHDIFVDKPEPRHILQMRRVEANQNTGGGIKYGGHRGLLCSG